MRAALGRPSKLSYSCGVMLLVLEVLRKLWMGDLGRRACTVSEGGLGVRSGEGSRQRLCRGVHRQAGPRGQGGLFRSGREVGIFTVINLYPAII